MSLKERLEENRRKFDEEQRRHREEMDRKYRARDNMVHTKDERERAIYEAIWLG